MPSTTKDFARYVRRELEHDPELAALVAQEDLNARVATLIHDAREAAGLSQAELARRVGTQQSVISRLEDADYDGHSLSMLKRIAEALGLQLLVEFQRRKLARKQSTAATRRSASRRRTG